MTRQRARLPSLFYVIQGEFSRDLRSQTLSFTCERLRHPLFNTNIYISCFCVTSVTLQLHVGVEKELFSRTIW